MDLAELRKTYVKGGLTEEEAHPDPVEQFRLWFQQSCETGPLEPNAMTLATADPDGTPNARTVLLKGFSEAGFLFYTNRESRKGRELARNPRAVLLFYWPELERQVRVSGAVENVEESVADTYFSKRPLGHQLGAWASVQSAVVTDREQLQQQWMQAEHRFEGVSVPRPPFWGGYRVVPNAIEFWQGRPNRLHDRLEYIRTAGGWMIRRLSP